MAAYAADSKRRSVNYARLSLRLAGLGLALYLAVLLVLSTSLVSYALLDTLEIFPALTPAEVDALAHQDKTAIVILSAGRRIYAPEFGGETVDEGSLERIRYGADLAKRTGLPVLVSGGLGTAEDPPLAQLMADALEHDYGSQAKWQETRSINTAENAMFSSAILKEAGIEKVVLVTHAMHMKRARASFLANGMAVVPAPTAFAGHVREFSMLMLLPNARALRMSGFALHEIVGSVWYRVKYGY
ncbi:MAG TPA: YdcF family protein [Micropepsaceae bacterium]|nr:YdcF family protein [Micropepsaceae bacterium]